MYDTSAIQAFKTPLGLQRYRLPATFPQMKKHRNISSDTRDFAVYKAILQDMLWQRQLEARTILKRKKLGLEMNAKRMDLKRRQKQKVAAGRTEIAQQQISEAYQVLAQALNKQLDFEWDVVKRYPEYPNPQPAMAKAPDPPYTPTWPREPQPTDQAFLPKLEAIDKIVRSKRQVKEREALARFKESHRKWEQMCLRMRKMYQEQISQYKQAMERLRQDYQHQMQVWEIEKNRYTRACEKCLQTVEHKKADYLAHEPHAVLDYYDLALMWSDYPYCFPHSFEMDYDSNNRLLMVDYLLPPLRSLPRLAEVIYNESDDAYHEILLTDEEREVLYVRALHEIPLRTFYELFTLDSAAALAAIQFRGYLFLEDSQKAIKPPACVLTIQADRGVFAAVDLYHTDSITLFGDLGGAIQPLE